MSFHLLSISGAPVPRLLRKIAFCLQATSGEPRKARAYFSSNNDINIYYNNNHYHIILIIITIIIIITVIITVITIASTVTLTTI